MLFQSGENCLKLLFNSGQFEYGNETWVFNKSSKYIEYLVYWTCAIFKEFDAPVG